MKSLAGNPARSVSIQKNLEPAVQYLAMYQSSSQALLNYKTQILTSLDSSRVSTGKFHLLISLISLYLLE